MTWDEVISLAKGFSRSEGGVEYHGLDIQWPWRYLPFAYGLPFTDTEGKVDLANPGWAEVLRLYKRAYDEQNNYANNDFIVQHFLKTRDVAMYAGNASAIIEDHDNKFGEFNWDMVTFPKYSGRELIWPANPFMFAPTKSSKHRELAFELTLAFQSEPMLETDRAKEQEMKNRLQSANKNIEAIYAMKPVKYVASKYDATANTTLQKKMAELQIGKDINTVLREWKEETEKQVESQKVGSK
ncbi:hypothetical protein ACFQ88_22920 [Paenibacillus sp. NPDC056579]|uniref:hypothetical protein n=1 Tax=Paenibacillus sp. NPDC056579 TaxID=3345871 RepID=UPI0036CBFBB0